MSLKTVYNVLDQFEISKTINISQAMSANAIKLFSGPSLNQLKDIVADISKVSNGSGLAIVSLLMWPDDEIPVEFNSFVNEIKTNLSKI